MTPDEFARYLAREDAEIREGMRATVVTTLDPELSAFDKGAEVALRALAESFEKNDMLAAAHATRRALAVVTGTADREDTWRCRCTYCVQTRGEVPEPWCPDHGYGCQPQDCPCGHSLRCDCVQIQNEH